MIPLSSTSDFTLRLLLLVMLLWVCNARKGLMLNTTSKGNLINFSKNISVTSKIPIFINDGPRNQTVSYGSQIVFQCRVYSSVQLVIKWYRKLPGKFLRHSIAVIQYDGSSYELLQTDVAKALGDNIYLSKLILQHVHWLDEGVYICASINLHGHRIRQAHLHVIANQNSNQASWGVNRKYCLLFIMPIALASLPASIWLPYMLYKRRQSQANLEDV